jgi:hypothetical protein
MVPRPLIVVKVCVQGDLWKVNDTSKRITIDLEHNAARRDARNSAS